MEEQRGPAARYTRASPARPARLHGRSPHCPSRQQAGALVLAAGLLALGNGVSALPGDALEHWAVSLGKGLLLLPLLYWLIRVQGLAPVALGLTARNLASSAGLGAVLAALVAVPVVLYFIFPLGVVGGSIGYEAMEEESWRSFILWVLLRQPLGTAVFEEIAFRGGLQALAIEAFGATRGVISTAATFSLWHVVINYRTIQETNVGDDPLLAVLAQGASLVGLLIGGLFLGILRLRSGNLSGPIVFHWLVVVAMNSTLFALSR